MNYNKLKRFLKGRIFLILVLLVIVLAITYIITPTSYTMANLRQILQNLAYMLIIGTGVASLLMCGGIDFATSAHASMSMLIFAMMLNKFPHLPWPIAAIIMLICGCAFGAVNAFLAEGMHMMTFICTIGMQSVWSGIAMWMSGGTIVTITNDSFNNITTKYLFGFIPVWFVFAIVICMIYNIIMTRTRFGRSITMVGGNPVAARLAGINPSKIRSIMFINNGLLAALGALVWASQQRQGSPSGLISGSPEMTALTAVMLGGVAFGGGSGSMFGAFLGILLINIVSYSLQVMNVTVWLTTLINGSLLVIALTVDRFTNKKSAAIGMPGMSK